MSTFWKLYMLFFAVPFPMILYYPIVGGGTGTGSSPWLALTILGLSVILWSTVLIKLFGQWILFPVSLKSNVESLLREGALVDAEILKVKKGKPVAPDTENLQLTVRMENFSGTPIQADIVFNDSKPHQNLHEVGKIIRLRVDRTLSRIPYLIPDGSYVSHKKARLVLLVGAWLLVLALIVGYYVFSYQLENKGTGWRFITFWHPLVICPASILFFFFGLFRFIETFGGLPKNILRIKFYGKQAVARILSAEQTGTYINEQPQVRFELEYTDGNGQVHQVSLKKIVNLLDVAITREKTISIFYLEEDPQQVAFAADLEF